MQQLFLENDVLKKRGDVILRDPTFLEMHVWFTASPSKTLFDQEWMYIISQKLNPFHEIKKVVICHVNNQKEVKRVSLSIGFVPLKGSLKIKSTIPLKTARLTLFLLGGGGSIWTPPVVMVCWWNFLTFSKYPKPFL